MDIDAVDFFGIDGDDRPRGALPADLVVKPLTLGERAGLGIRESVDPALGMEDDGAGHDRAGQAAPADFVNARNRYKPVAVQAVFDVATRGDLRH